MGGHIFISYSRVDSDYVSRLSSYLTAGGLDVWSDRGIQAAAEWVRTLDKQIRACRAFVPIMSPHAWQSEWVIEEILLAKALEKPIAPLLLAGEPFTGLRGVQYVDVRDGRMPDDAFVARLKEFEQRRVTGDDGEDSAAEEPLPTQSVGAGSALAWVALAHDRQARSVAFSADGRLLASAGEDERVALWDVRTGESRGGLADDRVPCWPLTFLPGSDRLLAAASYAAPGVHIFDVTTGAWQRSVAVDQRFGDEISALVFSGDGALLATGDPDGAVLWRADTGESLGRFSAGRAAPRWPLAFSNDGSQLAIAHRAEASGPVGVWNIRTRALDQSLSRHHDLVTCGAYSRDGSIFVTGSYDTTARVWDTASGTMQQVLSGHTQAINDVVLTHDGEHVITAGMDRSIRVWRTKTGELVKKLSGHRGGVYALALSTDGELLASAGGDGTVRLWRVAAAIAA